MLYRELVAVWKKQANVSRWVFVVVTEERDYPSYTLWRHTASISVESADGAGKGAVEVGCTCIAGLLALTLPFLARFLCSAGIAVGFYGNGETSDGIHRLTYSLRHANRTVAGVQDRVSTGGDTRANGECGNGQACSAPLLESGCACISSSFFVSLWTIEMCYKFLFNEVVLSSALLKISKEAYLVKWNLLFARFKNSLWSALFHTRSGGRPKHTSLLVKSIVLVQSFLCNL